MSTRGSNRLAPHPYRQAFANRDLTPLLGLLADDVVFHSPVIADQGFEGHDSVAVLLAIVLDAITDVEYTHELGVLSKPLAGLTAVTDRTGSLLIAALNRSTV